MESACVFVEKFGTVGRWSFLFWEVHRNFRRANDPVKSMGKAQIFDHKRRKEK